MTRPKAIFIGGNLTSSKSIFTRGFWPSTEAALPHGKVNVAISARQPGISMAARQPGIELEGR